MIQTCLLGLNVQSCIIKPPPFSFRALTRYFTFKRQTAGEKKQKNKQKEKSVLLQGKAQMVPTSVDVKLFNCGLTYCF